MATKGDVSGLEVLQFGGEPLIPLLQPFTGSKQSGVIRSDSPGGASRQRKRYFGTTYLYEATFFLDDIQMQDYFRMFLQYNEGKRFICHLRADRPVVEPYVIQIVSEVSEDYSSQSDGQVSMTIEVYSARDPELDETLRYLYSEYGGNIEPFILGIDDLVENHMKVIDNG